MGFYSYSEPKAGDLSYLKSNYRISKAIIIRTRKHCGNPYRHLQLSMVIFLKPEYIGLFVILAIMYIIKSENKETSEIVCVCVCARVFSALISYSKLTAIEINFNEVILDLDHRKFYKLQINLFVYMVYSWMFIMF